MCVSLCVYVSLCVCVCVCAGGGLLPGHESDHSSASDLHERGRRLLGSGQTAVGTEALHAR